MAIPSQLPSKNEQRIIRQLVESILFERLLPYQESDLQEDWKLFSITGAKRTYQCLGKRAAFDRVRLQGMPLISRSDSFQAIPTLAEIVEDAPLSKENQLALLHELEQTAHFSDWNDAHICKLPSRRDLSYDQLESALCEGHPYHPCFKARTGFTTADHRAYGNEADEGFKLTWIGLKKEAVAIYFPEEEHSFWQRELGYGQWSTIVKALCQAGGQLTEYRLFPVHPWQWDWLQKKALKEALANKDILYIGQFGSSYSATQSLRTLINRDAPEKAHLKLPLHVMNTSSIRTIEREVAAAPKLSAWLRAIVAQDRTLTTKYDVRVLSEYAGAAFEPADPHRARELNFLFRESVASHLQLSETAIPFNALALQEKDGELFIARSIETYGIEAWLEQLIEVSVIPIIHLCAVHGIALEAHGQNMILIVERGWPKGIMLRDFHESVEYYEPWIEDRAAIPPFAKLHSAFKKGKDDQYYWMSSPESLRELVMDTLFVYHLADLSWQLEQSQQLAEHHFWEIVNRCLTRYFDSGIVSEKRLKALGFDASVIATESLFKKKWTGVRESSHLIKNSIHKEVNQHVYR
ncbi:LOW QUALITY PROTEIN: anthrachelin biosynthesis protein AsbB [Bacillus sp. JCM 19045]|nr:LOW QUALITY PROTEIN: anthrachelin biosynthesis protein AsbB [Bacillus sp. JCM 19045]